MIFLLVLLVPVRGTTWDDAVDAGPGEGGVNPNPYLAGYLAMIFPGGGYFYQDEYGKGAASCALLTPMIAPYYLTADNFREKAVKSNAYVTARNLYFFTIYDSYQAALDKSGREKATVSIPHYSFWDMYLSPFDPRAYTGRNSTGQRTIDNIPLMIVALPALSLYFSLRGKGIHDDLTARRVLASVPLIILQSLFIGMGEEAYCRGFLYPAFSQHTGSPLAGNVLQSAYFGLAHTDFMSKRGFTAFPYGIGTAAFYTATYDRNREYYAEETPSSDAPDKDYFLSSMVFGFVMGLFVGYADDGLLKAIMIHSFWDAILITKDLLTEGRTGRVYLEFCVPYYF